MIPTSETFRYQMYLDGLETEDRIIANGKLQRFHIIGDRKGSKNGWYLLFPDFPSIGMYGCWKRNIKRNWQPHQRKNYSLSDVRTLNEREQHLQFRLLSEFESEHYSLQVSERIWSAAPPARDNHRYLQSKQVSSHGLRYHKGALLIPLMDATCLFHGMQRIWQDGSKRFSKGTSKTGNFFMIGEPHHATLLLCEGYATGATLHEVSDHAVIVAFDSGNLRQVAEAAHTAWPNYHIFVCADDDHQKSGNPGLTAATQAAEAIHGTVVMPSFTEDRDELDTDFNDMYLRDGPAAVISCLRKAGVDYV